MEHNYHEFYKFLKSRRSSSTRSLLPRPNQGEAPCSVDRPIFKYLRHLAESDQLEDYYKRPCDKSPVLPFHSFFKNAVSWCEHECEEIGWKKKPMALKALLKDKLGTEECSFEGVPVKLPSYTDGGKKPERCVIFPKSTDNLIELLISSVVFVDEEEEDQETPRAKGKPDDYETMLAEEMRKAEILEMKNMKAKPVMRERDLLDFNP